MIKKYRKLPVEIEAIQFTGTNAEEIRSFIARDLETNSEIVSGVLEHSNFSNEGDLSIYTLEGSMYANIGDFIIRGIQGEFYPCRSDIFLETYEIVNDEKQ